MINLFFDLFENHMEVFAVCLSICLTIGFLALNKIALPLMIKGMEIALSILYYPFTRKNAKKVVPISKLEMYNRVDKPINAPVYYGTLKLKVWHEAEM